MKYYSVKSLIQALQTTRGGGANTSIHFHIVYYLHTQYNLMIDHIDVCLCICKMTLQRSSLKCTKNVIQIDTCTTEIYFNFHFLQYL